MSFHLEGPWLSTVGKKKGKQKFRSAEQAKQARELEESWNQLKKKWSSNNAVQSNKINVTSTPTIYRRTTERPPSLESDHKGAVSSKQPQVYTGDQVIGITIVHKSCLQPIFSKQEAIDASKMRR